MGPYNKGPTIWGTILGSPIFGNPLIGMALLGVVDSDVVLWVLQTGAARVFSELVEAEVVPMVARGLDFSASLT